MFTPREGYRTFKIIAKGGMELRYRVNSPMALFDTCIRSRYRKYITEIIQQIDRYTYRLLATVKTDSPDSLEEACVNAWNNHTYNH